ncbi:beta strand repeat-containing protein [Rhodobacter lacus]|uniref:Beta strand repeat-containing protein n=1 Tax=Rhodobacter lacus TaxID=1641972 RepID=A0ABW5ACP6_9RHOB
MAADDFGTSNSADYVYATGSSFTLDAMAGNDTIYAYSGNIETIEIDGGDGADSISVYGQAFNSSYDPASHSWVYTLGGAVTVAGGAGNDSISVDLDVAQALIDGGAGNDTLQIDSYQSSAAAYGMTGQHLTVTTGEGSDTIALTNWHTDRDNVTVVSDFTAGAGGDVLDLSNVFWNLGWDGWSNPFGGTIFFEQRGADAVLLADFGYGQVILLTLAGVDANDLSQDNVAGGFLPDVHQATGLLLVGTDSADTLTGGADNDTLIGAAGNDLLIGGAGADRLDGGAGTDRASYSTSAVGVSLNLATGSGTAGDAAGDVLTSIEFVIGSAYGDNITGDSANNYLSGLAGDDMLVGGAGNDTLVGGLGADTLIGDSGADILEGGAGADIMDGGTGIDRVSYASSSAGVRINLATGAASGGDATGDVLLSIEQVLGSNYADYLLGSAADNVLSGGAGNDTLIGGAGADTLNGEAGTDGVSYYASALGVSVDLSTGLGSNGDAAGDLLMNIENVFGSAYGDALKGNDLANFLSGGAGNDTLSGGGGNDQLLGGLGADVLDGGSGTDIASYAASAGGVSVDLSSGIGIGGDAEGDILSGIETLIGSAYADRLTGDAGDNTIFGGTGNDNIHGGAGDDTLRGDAGGDTIDGGDGIDLLSYATSSAGVVVDLGTGVSFGGDASGDTLVDIENIFGSNYSDTLVGDAGDNRLHGAAGDDVITGNAGNDTLNGGGGADTFMFHLGDDVDRIGDFSAEDTIEIDTALWSGTFSTLVSTIAVQTVDTVELHFSGTDVLVIAGFNLADLSAAESQFVFV